MDEQSDHNPYWHQEANWPVPYPSNWAQGKGNIPPYCGWSFCIPGGAIQICYWRHTFNQSGGALDSSAPCLGSGTSAVSWPWPHHMLISLPVIWHFPEPKCLLPPLPMLCYTPHWPNTISEGLFPPLVQLASMWLSGEGSSLQHCWD